MQRKSRVIIFVRYFFLSRMIRWTSKITKLVSLCAIFIISFQPFDFSNSWFTLCPIIPCKSQEWILTLSRRGYSFRYWLVHDFFRIKVSYLPCGILLCFLLNLHFFLYFCIACFFTTLTIREHLFYFAIIFVRFGHYHDLWQSKS